MARRTKPIGGWALNFLPFLSSHLKSKVDLEYLYDENRFLAGCAVSSQCNNGGYEALEVLDSGRGAINRLTINSRNDLCIYLYETYPHLAKRFENLSSG